MHNYVVAANQFALTSLFCQLNHNTLYKHASCIVSPLPLCMLLWGTHRSCCDEVNVSIGIVVLLKGKGCGLELPLESVAALRRGAAESLECGSNTISNIHPHSLGLRLLHTLICDDFLQETQLLEDMKRQCESTTHHHPLLLCPYLSHIPPSKGILKFGGMCHVHTISPCSLAHW